LAVDARRFSRYALALCLLYAIFGVGVDALHSLFRRLYSPDTFPDGAYGLVDTLFELLEEGGELITATILLAFSVGYLYLNRGRIPIQEGLGGASARNQGDDLRS
jgi:hypothetical protein